MDILTYKPKYAEFMMDEGKRDHIDMEKFPERAMYKDVGVTVGSETGSADRKKHAKTMPTVGGNCDSR